MSFFRRSSEQFLIKVVMFFGLSLSGLMVLPANALQQPAAETASQPDVPCTVTQHYNPKRGKITVGCPKVWRSDRVFTVLDGILRDVDSITVQALQDLDPNQVNATELIKLVTDFQAGVSFDQQAAINSSLKRQRISAERSRDLENFNADKSNNELVLKQKSDLTKEKLALQNQERDLAAKGQTDPTQEPLKSLQARQNLIDTQLAGLPNSTGTIPDQSLSGSATPAASPTPTPTPDSTAAANSLTTIFQEALKNPSLPASMRMDNVIELLHQRLSREFSVLYDDLSRESEINDIYLVEFDIGIVPFNGAKNRDARVEFDFDDPKVKVQAYELYPGTSSYNILRGQDKTSRIGLSGMAQTVLGLGISSSFSRQKNQLRSGLSQSLFVSGFGAGRPDFGWQIGASPFEDLITPGSRIVNAIILVPKSGDNREQVPNLKFKARYCWPKQQTRYDFRGIVTRTAWFPFHTLGAPALKFGPLEEQSCAGDGERDEITMALPHVPKLTVERISYNPATLKETPGTQASTTATDKQNTVQITFKEPVDPNLTITVADKLINRVRDVRGRALFAKPETLAGTKGEQDLVTNSRFGILEKDKLDPDTWIQLNSKAILLSLSRDTAGTDTFPTITLSDPGWGGRELLALANGQSATKGKGSKENVPEIRIGEWLFQNAKVPESAFLPLFTKPYQPGRIQVYVDEVVGQPNFPSRMRIISETHRAGRSSPVWLHEQAQVVLVSKVNRELKEGYPDHWALACDGENGTLSCKIPEKKEILNSYKDVQESDITRFKVWVDEPPYSDRPGLWSDADLVSNGKGWEKEPYAKGEWSEIREVCVSCSSNQPWDSWQVEIKLANLPSWNSGDYVVPELEDQKLQRQVSQFIMKLDDNSNAAKNKEEKEYTKIESGYYSQFLGQPITKGGKVIAQSPEPGHREQLLSEKKIDPVRKTLSLTIAFEAIPFLPENLNLQGVRKAAGDPIVLPDLRRRLLPGAVHFTSLGNGNYRLEGERLRAVDGIRLESAADAILLKPIVGYNNVDFYLPPAYQKDKVQYNVFLLIRGLSFPAYRENQSKQLEQVTFTYEKPKDTPKTPPADGNPPDKQEKTNVKLNMDTHGRPGRPEQESKDRRQDQR